MGQQLVLATATRAKKVFLKADPVDKKIKIDPNKENRCCICGKVEPAAYVVDCYGGFQMIMWCKECNRMAPMK